ncbi:related to Alcohol dehydrogenase [Sporisorium reilianum f. sp. reilianum]|uniref:Related to Alcohol dehydrogenase n=1 Tax=Sporisorium reilianum f. sp. reilianum TaxID=72559 RepID=A0A2N8UL30_9BASI|nr:related to Alcohol dehydrogenase [Sporisorium reilianum f. sp. reilianum]
MSSTTHSTAALPRDAVGWRFDRRGLLPDTLKLASIPSRKLRPNEVLVKVHAAALNPVDWKLAALVPSAVYRCIGIQAITAGFDLAGEIVALAPNAKAGEAQARFRVGSRVFAQIGLYSRARKGDGSVATHAVLPLDALALMPDSLTYVDAAGFGIAATTAAMMARNLEVAQRVLILGAGTSVGLFLSQICRHKDAVLVGTASASKQTLVQQRGVDMVEHLRTHYHAQPFDWIFDCTGQVSVYYASPAFLKPQGTFYTIGANEVNPDSSLVGFALPRVLDTFRTTLLPAWLGGTPRRYVTGINNGDDTHLVERLVSEGVLTPVVDSVFPFEDAPKAYARIIHEKPTGKIVIKVSNDAE